MKFIDQVPWFVLKIKILMMTYILVMSHSSSKPVLVLSFDFGLTGSELLFVEIRELTNSSTLCLKCVLLIRHGRDQVHELCWWKYQQNQNITYSSLSLGTLNHDRINVMCIIYSYNMGNKIRRMTKRVELLNLWKDFSSL
jgi:hypothetical protein